MGNLRLFLRQHLLNILLLLAVAVGWEGRLVGAVQLAAAVLVDIGRRRLFRCLAELDTQLLLEVAAREA